MAYTNNDLRILINTVAGKNREGLISLDKFNNLLIAETRNYFDLHLRRYDLDWKSRKTLRPFVEEENGLDLSGSAAYNSISNDIARIIEMRSSENNPIEEIQNEGVWYDRLRKSIKAPTDKNPIGRLQKGSIEIQPNTVTLKDIIYLRYPDDPYLDGYVDSDGNFIYLDSGESSPGGEALLSGEASSQTSELGFEDEDKIEIAARMLGSLGITYNKQSLFQYIQMTNE